MKTYTFNEILVKQIREALRDNWFSCFGEINNEDVIAASEALEAEIKRQDSCEINKHCGDCTCQK